jgi:YHS domain-containing protein
MKMKKLSLIIAAGLLLASCSNNAGTPASGDSMERMAKKEKIAGPVDPVCGEARQADWTDFSVVGEKDTVWFCCSHDKAAYDKDPQKYAGK